MILKWIVTLLFWDSIRRKYLHHEKLVTMQSPQFHPDPVPELASGRVVLKPTAHHVMIIMAWPFKRRKKRFLGLKSVIVYTVCKVEEILCVVRSRDYESRVRGLIEQRRLRLLRRRNSVSRSGPSTEFGPDD